MVEHYNVCRSPPHTTVQWREHQSTLSFRLISFLNKNVWNQTKKICVLKKNEFPYTV